MDGDPALARFVEADAITLRRPEGMPLDTWTAIGESVLASGAQVDFGVPVSAERTAPVIPIGYAEFRDDGRQFGADERFIAGVYCALANTFRAWLDGGMKDPDFPLRFMIHPTQTNKRWDETVVSDLDFNSLVDYIQQIDARLEATSDPEAVYSSVCRTIGRSAINYCRRYVELKLAQRREFQ